MQYTLYSDYGDSMRTHSCFHKKIRAVYRYDNVWQRLIGRKCPHCGQTWQISIVDFVRSTKIYPSLYKIFVADIQPKQNYQYYDPDLDVIVDHTNIEKTNE